MAVRYSSLVAADVAINTGPMRCGVLPHDPAHIRRPLWYLTDGVKMFSHHTGVPQIVRTASRFFSGAPRQSALQCSRTPTLRSCAPLPRLTEREQVTKKSRPPTRSIHNYGEFTVLRGQDHFSSVLSPSLQATSSTSRIAWLQDHSNATPTSPPLLTAKASTNGAETMSTAATLEIAKAQIYEIIQETHGSLKPASTECSGTSEKIGGSLTLYAAEDVRQRMESLVSYVISQNPSNPAGPASLSLGQGVWEVFHAPHISRVANLLNIRFDPIRYSLRGTKIWSNVHYQVPLLGEGWLSASGSFSVNGDNAVNVLFDSFWWDSSPQSLRSEDPHIEGPANDIINAIGKLAFLPQFSTFPVLYVDGDMTVFQFPPLASNIAARKIDTTSHLKM